MSTSTVVPAPAPAPAPAAAPTALTSARRVGLLFGVLVALLLGLLSPATRANAVVCPIPAPVAPGAAEVARHGVPAACYQGVFNAIVGSGYRLVWVDGFSVAGETYYNAIFRPANGTSWASYHGLTSAQYQAKFDALGIGWRPTHLDVYESGGAIRYAVIFAKQAGPSWVAYHGLTPAQHQAKFDALTPAGWRPVVISVGNTGGGDTYAALYLKTAVGSFYARSDLTAAQYQATFDANTAAGRRVIYVNGHSHNGSSRISAIWWQTAASGPARHGLTSAGYQAAWDQYVKVQHLLTRAVSGYDAGGSARYVAFWTP